MGCKLSNSWNHTLTNSFILSCDLILKRKEEVLHNNDWKPRQKCRLIYLRRLILNNFKGFPITFSIFLRNLKSSVNLLKIATQFEPFVDSDNNNR